jgi:hypothetical protein
MASGERGCCLPLLGRAAEGQEVSTKVGQFALRCAAQVQKDVQER